MCICMHIRCERISENHLNFTIFSSHPPLITSSPPPHTLFFFPFFQIFYFLAWYKYMELFPPKIIIIAKLMLLLLLSLTTIIIITQPPLALDEIRTPLGAVEVGSYFQMKGTDERSPTTAGGGGTRRLLSGPGSFPPRCTSKCGRCVPCKPVHVPVPPGTPVTAEYYPEAWRCKCGNKYYMP